MRIARELRPGNPPCQQCWLNSKAPVEDEVSDLQSVSKAFVLGIDVADLGEQIFPPVRVEIEVGDVPLDSGSVMFLQEEIERLTRR